MRIKLAISTIIILFFSSISYACDCIPLRLKDHQKFEIENSQCIFIGEVFEINESEYKIKVIESLDGGDAIGNIYIGKNSKSCSPYIDLKGK